MADPTFCASCGSPQDAGANFCFGCGLKLDSTSVPPLSSGTTAIGQAIADKAAAVVDQTATIDRLADFDGLFVSCMDGKGFTVTPGSSKGLYAYLEEKASGPLERDWLIEHLLLPELQVELTAWGIASEAFEHRSFLLAAADCAHRAWQQPPQPPEILARVPVLPPPPPDWQPMVVPPSPPSAPPKSAGGGVGKAIGALVFAGAIGVGIFAGLRIVEQNASAPTTTPNPGPVVPVSSVAITSFGSIACKTTVHGGYVYEVNCDSSVTLEISGDVTGDGVTVLMDEPNGTMHGSAPVSPGFRGTITVPLHVQYISSACTAYPNYQTTAYVYAGQTVNSGPELARRDTTYNLTC